MRHGVILALTAWICLAVLLSLADLGKRNSQTGTVALMGGLMIVGMAFLW